MRSFDILSPLPSFAPLILLEILFDRGVIDLRIEQRALNVAMPQLLAHGRDWHSCLEELTGSAVTELVDRGLNPSRLAVFLSGIMDNTVL